MIFYREILAGVAIGLVLGAVNFYLMRLFVRMALKNPGRARGVSLIIAGYVLRYLLIGAAVFGLVKLNEHRIALIGLAALASLTVLLAFRQRGRAKTAAGVSGETGRRNESGGKSQITDA